MVDLAQRLRSRGPDPDRRGPVQPESGLETAIELGIAL